MRNDADFIRSELTNRLEAVLDRYFQGHKVVRGKAYLAVKDKNDLGSWSVTMNGAKRGQWFRFSAGVGGGVVELIAYQLYGRPDAYADAFREARAFLGISGAVDEEANQRARKAQQQAKQKGEAEQQMHEADTREAAQAIWDAAEPMPGTLAETYLHNRGITYCDASVFRFERYLKHPTGGRFQSLICRVDDLSGDLTAVWRVYLTTDGHKADLQNPKLGLGPAGGGAVRIGGIGKKLGLAEGVESALGAWNLIGRRYPVWSCLSTSGLTGIELPLGVEHVCIFMDGDRAMKKQGNEYVPAVPAGRKAALALRERLLAEGVSVSLAAEPGPGQDYNDLWLASIREDA